MYLYRSYSLHIVVSSFGVRSSIIIIIIIIIIIATITV